MSVFERGELFIDGAWVPPSTDAAIDVVSPHTEQVIGRAAAAAPADVDRAVAAARTAFDTGPWPRLSPQERIAAVERLASAYKERRGEMADLISAEIGAPITFAKHVQSRLPLNAMAAFCAVANELPWQEDRPGFYGRDIRIAKLPVGVVAAIVPWNMPQFLTVGKVVPRYWRDAPSSSNPHPSRRSTRCCSPTSSPRPDFRPACSTWCRVTAPSARIWSRTAVSTRSPSPVRPRRVVRWRWRVPPASSR